MRYSVNSMRGVILPQTPRVQKRCGAAGGSAISGGRPSPVSHPIGSAATNRKTLAVRRIEGIMVVSQSLRIGSREHAIRGQAPGTTAGGRSRGVKGVRVQKKRESIMSINSAVIGRWAKQFGGWARRAARARGTGSGCGAMRSRLEALEERKLLSGVTIWLTLRK